MNSFDINRFGKTIRWSLITEKKSIIKTFVSLFVAYFLMIGANSGLFSGYKTPIEVINIYSASTMCFLTWIIAGGILTSELFSNLRTKQQRTAYFMLPASNAEKYWSRVLLAMFEALIVSTVAYIAGDLLNMLLTQVFTGTSMSTFTTTLDPDFNEHFLSMQTSTDYMEGIALFTTLCWSVTSYILGGTVFRKLPVVFTTLAWNVLWIIFGMGVLSLFQALSPMLKDVTVEFWWGTEFTGELVLAIVGALFSVFNMWMSYRIFTRMDINANKLLNI